MTKPYQCLPHVVLLGAVMIEGSLPGPVQHFDGTAAINMAVRGIQALKQMVEENPRDTDMLSLFSHSDTSSMDTSSDREKIVSYLSQYYVRRYYINALTQVSYFFC